MFLHWAATDSGPKRAQSRKPSASSRVEGKPREMSSTGSKKGNLRVELRKGRICTGGGTLAGGGRVGVGQNFPAASLS